MNYITHKRAEHDYQLLKDHLVGVAELAAEFASVFGSKAHAYRIGLLHDIGKYSAAAQARQRDPDHTARVDHSSAGSQEAFHKLRDLHAALVIAGHHGGLPDLGSRASREDGTLMARQKKQLDNENNASAWKNEIILPDGIALPKWLVSIPPSQQGFANATYTRMLFSCLVDADYLDTERFMSFGKIKRGSKLSIPELLQKLQLHIKPWLKEPATEINAMRSHLLCQCLQRAQTKRGLYTLTIPTGGGKTISSLAFALAHAVEHKMDRIIYVIPYTSIIEQNAQVFRSILGQEAVLEHHSNVELDDVHDERTRLSTENWDAPIIVTTAVQFFESLFASSTSRCRKLHNIANSVVIFDEAQMLPIPYLQPCVAVIAELVEHYGVTAVLCTATQPALNGLFQAYAPNLHPCEIVQDTSTLYAFFRRVRFVQEGIMDLCSLSEHLTTQKQALCIVNARKTARTLYQHLASEGTFHLSTLMTPEHRSATIAEIRTRLAQDLPCRVVSTSLIEAGVDVDFPSVWREESGLDSIMQAAGRCNREGKRPVNESFVHIFRLDDKPPLLFAQNIYALKKAIEQHSDISSLQAIETYFHHLLFTLGERVLDIKQIMAQSNQMAFRSIQEDFQLIENQTIPVYIPTPENETLLQKLREGSVDKQLFRTLGRDSVNVYPQHFQALKNALDCPKGDSYGILLDPALYNENCGLTLEPQYGEAWFA